MNKRLYHLVLGKGTLNLLESLLRDAPPSPPVPPEEPLAPPVPPDPPAVRSVPEVQPGPAVEKGTLSQLDGVGVGARININTAPREVLITIPGLAEADADAIIGARPRDSK